MQYQYLHTREGLTVIINGRPYSVSSHHPSFAKILAGVYEGWEPQLLLQILEERANAVKKMLQRQLTENLRYEHGVVFYKGEVLHNHAVTRMLEMINRFEDVAPVANFIEKLMKNPLPGVVQDLYAFLEAGTIPLTPDGDFLVYKAVRPDYKDIHSGTFLNAVGCEVKIPRESVDPDRNRTCSHGLHVCSYGYLPSFSHAGGHVMMCKVDPSDVVAIPSDYNNTKMRVCRYRVVGEVTSYYQNGEDYLGKGPAVRAPQFEVYYRAPEDDAGELYEEYYTLAEAKAQADALKASNAGYVVWVEPADREETLYTA